MKFLTCFMVVGSLCLSGCTSGDSVQPTDMDEAVGLIQAQQYGKLIHGSWTIASYSTANGEFVEVTPDSEFNFMINFPNEFTGKASGKLNCGYFSGDYSTEENVLTIDLKPVKGASCTQPQNDLSAIVESLLLASDSSLLVLSSENLNTLSLANGHNQSIILRKAYGESATRNIDFSLLLTGSLYAHSENSNSESRYLIIQNQAELLQLYDSTLNCELCVYGSPPPVNFTEMSVVFLASARQGGVEAGIEIANVIMDKEENRVIVDVLRPTVSAECPVAGAEFQPFAIYQVRTRADVFNFIERTEIYDCWP